MSDLGRVLPNIQPANEIALPIVPTETIRITLSGKSLFVYSSSYPSGGGRLPDRGAGV